MKYFSSDWHLSENRLGKDGKNNPYNRPFKNVVEENNTIKNNFLKTFKEGDTFYMMGDLFSKKDSSSIKVMNDVRNKFKKSKFILLKGDEDKFGNDIYFEWFDEIHNELYVDLPIIGKVCLNHFPQNIIKQSYFGITGHVHDLWKIQKRMVNVGVDCWHYFPVSENQIASIYTELNKRTDDRNLFPYM